MRFEKQDLFELKSCYSVKHMEWDGRQYVVFATELEGPACCVDLETLEVTHISEGPGGTMCMVPVPGENGNFLSAMKFYKGFNSADACIMYSHRDEEGVWHTDKLFDLPYVHRFDLLHNGDRLDFIGGVLCRSKQFTEDWSDPGYIAVGSMDPQDLTRPVDLRVIKDGLTKNHGYGKVVHDGIEQGLLAAQEGVFLVTPPVGGRKDWEVECLLDHPTSEARLFDIDGDGVEELITIEPFHGPGFKIYHQTAAGYEERYSTPEEIDFCHVIWGGSLRGKTCILGACRSGAASLFMITYEQGAYHLTTIDAGVAPTNIDVIPGEACDIIASANNGIGRAAFYRVYDN